MFAGGVLPRVKAYKYASAERGRDRTMHPRSGPSLRITNYTADSIDTADGSLHITVTHLFSFRAEISLAKSLGSLYIYHVVPPEDRSKDWPNLHLLSMGRLDIQPGKDHLFIADSIAHTYLILRQQSDHSSSYRSFKLVTARIRLLGL
jgi:hypothetical protein